MPKLSFGKFQVVTINDRLFLNTLCTTGLMLLKCLANNTPYLGTVICVCTLLNIMVLFDTRF